MTTITVQRRSAVILGASILVGSLAVAGAAGIAGFVVADSKPDPAVEASATTYTMADVEAILEDCEVTGHEVDGGTITMQSSEVAVAPRRCLVSELAPPTIVVKHYEQEFANVGEMADWKAEGGDYMWSNLHLVWTFDDRERTTVLTVG